MDTASTTGSRNESGDPGLAGLQVRDEPVPEFVAFLFDVGARAAEYAHHQRSLHVGLLLPTDAYAAVFVALGAEVRRSNLQPAAGGEDAVRRMEQIRELANGEPVWFLDRGRKYKGIYEGFRTSTDDVERVMVRIEDRARGGLTMILPPERILDVIPADDVSWEDLPMSQKGSALRGSPELVEAVYGREVNAVLTVPRVDAVLVGRKSSVLEELDLRCTSERGQGELRDLVRLKEAGFGSSYRCRWLSAGSNYLEDATFAEHRPVVVFNGASNHLNGFHRVHGAVSVSVIGAVEPQAPEAIEDLQSALFLGTHQPSDIIASLEAPPGVSVFAMEG